MNIKEAQEIIRNAVEGSPNSCISEHQRGLESVYNLLIALDRISEAPASSVVADAPRTPPTPRLKLYDISITLEGRFSAADEDEAWEQALDKISGRTGMQLCGSTVELVT